ncbi:molybdopterin-guanine dinucleotide biosynthesis protein MobC, partial [Escherichia coli]|nr:molybdopterin-guanine dinucleotide biosynthesis protein MobC [Escherichia coli]
KTHNHSKTPTQTSSLPHHKSLYSLLTKIERMGLIQNHMLESRTINISLWGITSDGLAAVLTPNDKIFPARFEPSKITGWTL